MVKHTFYGNIARLIGCGLTLIEQYLIDLFSWREPANKQFNTSEGGRGMGLWMINTITIGEKGVDRLGTEMLFSQQTSANTKLIGSVAFSPNKMY